MANLVDSEYISIEGVHILSESSYRKYVRTLPVLSRERCRKRDGHGGIKVKRCQGCWSVGFCSQELTNITVLSLSSASDCSGQYTRKTAEYWRLLDLEELARHFYSDPFLLHYLRVALILKLGLLESPSSTPPNHFASVIVHMHIHPISEEHERDLYLGNVDGKGKDKIPGHLTVGINEPVNYIPLVNTSRIQNQDRAMIIRSYRQARKDADSKGRSQSPIVMVDFGYNRELINIGIEITSDAFETAQGHPPSYAATPPPLSPLSQPLELHAILRMLGNYIKLDQDDKLKLRRELRPIDKNFMYEKAQYVLYGLRPS